MRARSAPESSRAMRRRASSLTSLQIPGLPLSITRRSGLPPARRRPAARIRWRRRRSRCRRTAASTACSTRGPVPTARATASASRSHCPALRNQAGLQARLDRPVLHDDQHGTAVVMLAAVLNATRRDGGQRSATRSSARSASTPPASASSRPLATGPACGRVLGTDLDAGRRAASGPPWAGEAVDARGDHAEGRHRHRNHRRARV